MARRNGVLLAAIVVAVILTTSGIGQVVAQDTPNLSSSGLLIYNVWVRPTAGLLAEGETPEPPLPNTVTGAFMTIESAMGMDYQLIGVSSDAAEMSHIHETTSSGGMSGMRMISAIDIPAGETVRLESNGYHAMLMNVTEDIRPGDAVPLTLTFADMNGARFDVVTAGIATDFPPEESTIIAANAVGMVNDDGTVDVSMIIDNQREEIDHLVNVASMPNATSGIVDGEAVLASAEIGVGRQALTIHLSDFETVPDEALVLTLTFEAGGELTLAVPVLEDGA